MKKSKLTRFKDTKKKLSPAERSQVAKDRWAKIKAAKEPVLEIAGIATNVYYAPQETGFPVQGFVEGTPPPPQPPEQPPAAPESITFSPKVWDKPIAIEEVAFIPESPSPQPVPVAPKKAKRYTGPKEFSVALKAAESRLAKAIVERAQAAGQLAALQAEIPSLVQIINALKGPQNIPAAPYDFSGVYPATTTYQLPPNPQFQPYVDPMAAIAGAAAAPPMSRASGGAIQFPPDALGTLEGPEDDDDPDRYITGPLAGGGWK